jgi:hypothetical protein
MMMMMMTHYCTLTQEDVGVQLTDNKGFYRWKLHQNSGNKKVNPKGDWRNYSHLNIRITVSIVTRLRKLQPEEGAWFLRWSVNLSVQRPEWLCGPISVISNGYRWLLPREVKRPGQVSLDEDLCSDVHSSNLGRETTFHDSDLSWFYTVTR